MYWEQKSALTVLIGQRFRNKAQIHYLAAADYKCMLAKKDLTEKLELQV